MCGIFGAGATAGAKISRKSLKNLIRQLYILSEARGKESAGLHLYLPQSSRSWTVKENIPASQFIKKQNFLNSLNLFLDEIYQASPHCINQPIVILGHSRLVTNGNASESKNNQPVQVGFTTVVHNGIVVNVDQLWSENPQLTREAAVDTEIIAALLNDLSARVDKHRLVTELYAKLQGSASIAWVRSGSNCLSLATNTGDLYYTSIIENKVTVFASESYILDKCLANFQPKISSKHNSNLVKWLSAGTKIDIELCGDNPLIPCEFQSNPSKNFAFEEESAKKITTISSSTPLSKLYHYNPTALKSLRRCSRCILPETFPFIKFDNHGVCSYCHHYKPCYQVHHNSKMSDEFIKSLEHYRKAGTSPDVIVPFSGGRDSSYGLHILCKNYGFKPVTFTYDWGMVTDLARRNIARMCGELGVQNILVSANIQKKRANIRKNILAWLEKPRLGMIPLFMAGDKAFFSIVNNIKAQTAIKLNLWCANPLENTDFKTGFCGVSPDFDKDRLDYLSLKRKSQLISYYLSNFLSNPSYLNGSLFDTFQAYVSYYMTPRDDFFFLFNHVLWDEHSVNDTLLNSYDWEISPDSPSTWRIGDGTAPFYNYIYCTARGFTEFDTFRSNQVREGFITRDFALASVLEENRPREDSLRWYFETLNLSEQDVIKQINKLDQGGLHQ